MPLPAYHRDAYLRTLETEVVERGHEGDRPYLVLRDTVLYPEGGGQPADRGSIGEVEVLDVQRRDGAVRHYVAAPVEANRVLVSLDWDRRFDAMQQHSAQHLLSAVAEDRFGWRTTAFHLGPQVCDVELDTPSIEATEARALEEAIAERIREARPLTARFVPPADMAALPVRSRGLPEGHHGDVRLVEIQGVDLNTCGGTHVRNTAELESVTLLHHEPMRGGTRLHFVAGRRVRARLAAAERLHHELRLRLGVPDEGLCDALDRRAEELRALGRKCKRLENERGEQVVHAIAEQRKAGSAVAHVHLEDASAEFLRSLTRPLQDLTHDGAAWLSAVDSKGSGAFLLVLGEASVPRARAALAVLAAPIGGRGGGVGAVLQGRATVLDPGARSAATDALTQWLSDPGES